MSGYYNKSKEIIIMCDIKLYKHGGFNMIVTDEEVMRIQDDMMELQRRVKNLKEVVCVLESGFEALNDDNCNYAISSLRVIEEQLGSMKNLLSKDLDRLASIIEA